MTVSKGLIILGFGGHARSIADVALASGIEELLFVDDNAGIGEQFFGFPVQKSFEGSLPEGWGCLPASGDNKRRELQIEFAKSRGWPIATLISSTATIGIGSVISPGCFVAHHAHIGPMTTIGKGTIINTGAIVEHDCAIGDFTHISIGAIVAGRSTVGHFCSVFAGSTVIDSLNICNEVIVGGSSLVINDIQESGVYVGVPAKRLA